MENIIVVFPKADDARNIKNLLVKSGYHVDAICTSGAQALEYAHSLNGGLCICSYRYVDMYYTQLKEDLPSSFDMLLIASRANWLDGEDESIIKVSPPLKTNDLLNTVQMMFEAQTRRRKKAKLQPKTRSEEDMKTLKEAKAILMERNHMSEDEAHKYLQKCSMDSGNSIVETAKMVLCLYHD